MQEADSRQIATYSCGHEVTGPRIDRAEQARPALDIERRTSDETVPPPEDERSRRYGDSQTVTSSESAFDRLDLGLARSRWRTAAVPPVTATIGEACRRP